jgi:hypothetical protein
MRWMEIAIVAAGLSGCAQALDGASGSLDAPQDADPEAGKLDAPGSTCASVRCGNPDAVNILFPGNPVCEGGGCERALAGDDLFIPPRNGRPWQDTYELGTRSPDTLSGYSSGRIALLRRLALVGDGAHAVMVDPSWPDGARDFTGDGPEHGEDIVQAWLRDDPARTFLLIYSTRSVGWSGYAALRDSEVGARVKVCAVDKPHLLVPAVPGLHAALVDPDAWDNGACAWGKGAVEPVARERAIRESEEMRWMASVDQGRP